MNKRKYSNIIYAFDIETTTYNNVTSHYLSNFQSVNFDCRNMPNSDIISNISSPTFCRNNNDVNLYFEHLNQQAENEGLTYLIYIHNLSYEFDYLIKNIAFFRENFEQADILFLKPRIPVTIRIKNIELRCSYKLLNKSLRELGKNLNYPKLEIDYKALYFEFSKLPQIEYEYNERDVKLTLLAVLKECSQWEYIKSVNDIPITSTGLTRKNNQYINDKKSKDLWAGLCNYQRSFDKQFIDFIESTYTGGYTHANALFFGKPLKNVLSIDIVSSYPHSILHRNYPHYFKKYKGTHKYNYLKFCIAENKITYKDIIKNYKQPFKRAFLATVKLVNIQAKHLPNNNLILPLSYSKCVDVFGCVLDNGRIYSAKRLITNLTEVDFWILEQFYTFDIEDCFELYYTNYYRQLPEYVTNSTRTYLHQKSTLKSVLKHFENGEDITPDLFYNDNLKGYIFNDEQINSICTLERTEQEQTLNDSYRASKNRLNAQYGINVQKLLQPNIKYDIELDEYITTYPDCIETKRLYRDFIKGLYITAYSRLTLFVFALYLIDNTHTSLVYSDTDSWKCFNDIESVKHCVDDYNIHLNEIINNSADYNVGNFDCECIYSNFCTLGCKKYITSAINKKTGKDEITTTIAGVNKYKTSQAFTELYKSFDYDFKSLCQVAFSPCTVLSSTVTGKLVTKYSNDEYSMTVTDENGAIGHISGRNMVELVESDYILMDITKGSINEYIDYAMNLQNSVFNNYPTLIYKEGEQVKYKYITNWCEQVKILKTHNPEFDNIMEV